MAAMTAPMACAPAATKPGAPAKWPTSETRHRLPDGRFLAYHIRGKPSHPHAAIWLHGILSSRYEVMSTSEDLLDELGLYLVGVDRPSYGLSSLHRRRSFQSFAEDVASLADELGLQRFFVVGVSGGGPYALACAYYLRERVRGVMTLSAPYQRARLTRAENAKWEAHDKRQSGRAFRRLLKVHPVVLHLLAHLSETYFGGRFLYERILKGLAGNIDRSLATVDAACLRDHHPEHAALVVPESLRQRTGTSLAQDAELLFNAWPFSPSHIAPALARAVHIWQGTGDRQVAEVCADALHRDIPGSHLHVVPGGGHFAYYLSGCDGGNQRVALTELLRTGLPA